MRTHKAVLAAVLAAGIATGLPGATAAHPAAKDRPHAHAAGSDAPPVLPGGVRVRIKRGLRALDKAGDYVDKDQPSKAIYSLRGARRNMYAAWRSAKYRVEHAPPPAPAEGKVTAHASDDGPAGPVYASPEESAVAVLGYQHEVVSSTLGLIDGAKGSLRDELSKTLFAAMDRRDSAIAYIHTKEPPAPPAEGKAVAHAADEGPVGFAGLMPGIIPDLDDEHDQAVELLAGGALTPGEKRIVKLANAQGLDTKNTVQTYWPPAPAEG